MRELKFRFWDKSDKRIHGNDRELFSIRSDGFLGYQNNKDNSQENQILMQSTGLKDKNEKEIFEGDIIQIGDTRYEIYWDERFAEWGLMGTSDSLGFMFNNLKYADKKVIGNIYENPELTKHDALQESIEVKE